MSLALKIGSLAIRTLAKPIANGIKGRARDHDGFRRFCVGLAQRVHRLDMRMRLGLINDAAALDRLAAREAAEAQAKKHKPKITTVKTEAQTKADEAAAVAREKQIAAEVSKPKPPKPRIRPLSEAKAIDTGASFISEGFLFLVAASLVTFESLRSRRKEASRRVDVAERLRDLEEEKARTKVLVQAVVQLEKEIVKLQSKVGVEHSHQHMIPKELWQSEEKKEAIEPRKGWISRLTEYVQKRRMQPEEESEAIKQTPDAASTAIVKSR